MSTLMIFVIFWPNMTLPYHWETDCVRGPSTMPTTKHNLRNWIPWASWCFVPGKRMYRRSSKVLGMYRCIKSKKTWSARSRNVMMRRFIRSVLWSPTLLRDTIILPPLSERLRSVGWARPCFAMSLRKSILPCRIKKMCV